MSKNVKLSAALPANDEINGMDSLHDDLVSRPESVVCALVWLDVPKVTIDTATGEKCATMRVRKIEPFGAVDRVPEEVIRLYTELNEKRTGRKPLPFDQLDGNLEHVETTAADEPPTPGAPDGTKRGRRPRHLGAVPPTFSDSPKVAGGDPE